MTTEEAVLQLLNQLSLAPKFGVEQAVKTMREISTNLAEPQHKRALAHDMLVFLKQQLRKY